MGGVELFIQVEKLPNENTLKIMTKKKDIHTLLDRRYFEILRIRHVVP